MIDPSRMTEQDLRQHYLASHTITVDFTTWVRLYEYAASEGITLKDAACQLIEFGELYLM